MKLSTHDSESLKDYCLNKLEDWAQSTERINHLNQVQDDRELADKMKEAIDERRMRSPILYKAKLAYDVQARHMPYVSPYKAGKYTDDVSVIESYKDLLFSKLGVPRIFASVMNQAFTDGQVWVQLGTDEGVMTLDVIDPSEIVVDPQATAGYCSNYLDRSRGHRIISRRVGYTQEDFDAMFPEHSGTSGEAFSMTTQIGKTAEQRTNEARENEQVYVDYIYGATCFDEPFMIAVAGGDRTIVQELRGKEYPHFKNTPFGKEPFLPFVNFDMTSYRQGVYPMSKVSLLKEVHLKYEKFISDAVFNFNKILSKKYALIGQGAGDVDIQEELKNAELANMRGADYVMALETGANIDLKSFSADPRIINEYMAVRDTLLREASTISGINFMLHAEEELRATVFLGKNKSELQAIGAVYKINENCFFNRLADILINTSKDKIFRKMIEKATLSLSLGGGDFKIPVADLKPVIDSWDGEFRTDTDLKVPPSTSDTLRALQMGRVAFANLLYATPYQSIEEIEPILNAMNKEANMMGVDDVFGKDSILLAAQKVLDQKLGQQQEMNAQPEPQQTGELGAEEANKELSPNTALADANII